jgi:predicted RNA binding protein YcfA (HicA-like mRNA interferase family)
MPRLPVVSGREARRVFQVAGWAFDRQDGSHMVLVKDGVPANLSVPDYRELPKGTLRQLIRLSGLTRDEFIELLNR